jgi:nucleoid-associated protein YgaU
LEFMVIGTKAAIAAASFVLVAAGGAAILVGGDGLRQVLQGSPKSVVRAEANNPAKAETRTETRTASAEPFAALPSAPQAAAPSNGVVAALGQAKEKATSALADIPAPSAPRAIEDSGPRFDVARVDDEGEAVIAGRAAPGARVDLLRDGEKHDSAVADGAGLFVMTPPKLPPGSYRLSLQSTAPDGSVAQSKAGVPVTVNAPASRPAPARADVAKGTKEGTKEPAKDESVVPAQAAAPTGSVLALVAAPPEKGPVRRQEDTTTGSTSSRVVSRGDSLWLISRRTYGSGLSYALIYNANRDKIHDPDRIYPGQTFVLPRKAR